MFSLQRRRCSTSPAEGVQQGRYIHLYEELLIKTEELDKTENSLIFIERDEALTLAKLQDKLSMLHAAVETEDDETAKLALMKAVPSYHKPEDVNKDAVKAAEMKLVVEKEATVV